jgi:hypothetical protein
MARKLSTVYTCVPQTRFEPSAKRNTINANNRPTARTIHKENMENEPKICMWPVRVARYSAPQSAVGPPTAVGPASAARPDAYNFLDSNFNIFHIDRKNSSFIDDDIEMKTEWEGNFFLYIFYTFEQSSNKFVRSCLSLEVKPLHYIDVNTWVYHDICEGRVGRPSAVVRETHDLNKMIYCFNCQASIFVNETYWPDSIDYKNEEVLYCIVISCRFVRSQNISRRKWEMCLKVPRNSS